MLPKRRTLIELVLDISIAGCLALIPVILLTGGFKLRFGNFSIGATHLYTPLGPMLLLVALRLALRLRPVDFLLLTGSIGIGVATAELAVRIWNPPISRPQMQQLHRPARATDWELTPGAAGVGALGESYRINEDGYRGERRPLHKPTGVQRIAVIGDSFTFGMGVDLEHTFPKQLESFLNRKSNCCEVLNFGVIGYDMWQYHEILTRKALAYQPDIIILALYQNDLKHPRAPDRSDPNYQPHNPFARPTSTETNSILHRSALWNLIGNVYARIEYKYRYLRGHDYLRNIPQRKAQWGTAQSGSEEYRILSGAVDPEKKAAFAQALTRFADTTRASGARLLLAYIPDSIQLNDPALQGVNRLIAQWAQSIDTPFIDLTPILERDPLTESLYLFPFDAHNSPKGLRLIAQALAESLARLGYVTP